MKHIHANDGRILTPPKELKPLLKGSFPAFYKLLGHIRFFYVADEIWDGAVSLIFQTDGEMLAAMTLIEGSFNIKIKNENYSIDNESRLTEVFEKLKKTAAANQHRPKEQLIVDLDEYPNGIRCDLCQLNRKNNINDLSGCENFQIMNRHCYYGVEEGWGESSGKVDSTWICEGKQGCYTKSFACLAEKGFNNCFECGEYHTCESCGVGHNPGECNLGITGDEITKLIIPYCEMERLDFSRAEG